MTNEYRFNVGDRVTLAGDTNAIGTIRHVGKETCIVDFGMGDSTVGYKDIQPLDRRTAFLTRLQSLLREFDATIDCRYNEYAKADYPCVIFKDEETLWWLNNDGITADNIMDFDKEGV